MRLRRQRIGDAAFPQTLTVGRDVPRSTGTKPTVRRGALAALFALLSGPHAIMLATAAMYRQR